MSGLSTKGNISLGEAFVAGRNRVPQPAAGMTAFLTVKRDMKPILCDGVYEVKKPLNRSSQKMVLPRSSKVDGVEQYDDEKSDEG